jgi:hypothetical protein
MPTIFARYLLPGTEFYLPDALPATARTVEVRDNRNAVLVTYIGKTSDGNTRVGSDIYALRDVLTLVEKGE